MNKSIRVLDLDLNILKKLENLEIFRIYELIRADLVELNFHHHEVEKINQVLDIYKYNELKRELRGRVRVHQFEYLDSKYSIDDLNLSLRSFNALKNSKINSISKLLFAIEDMDIYNIGSLGSKSIVQVMKSVNEIIHKEKLTEKIPLYQKHHQFDELTIQQMGFSQSAIMSLTNLNLDTLGKLRHHYLNGKLAEFFNYKTLKVILDEFSKYFSTKISNEFFFLKNVLIEKYLGKIKIDEIPNLIKEDDFIVDVESVLKKLENRPDILIENDYLRLPYLVEKLKEVKLKKESEAILIARFNGLTLQAVADQFGKTRERIRQIVRDRMAQISMFFEESLVKEYNKFVWHPAVFKKVYNINDFSFNTVKYLGKKFSFEEEYEFPEEYIQYLFNHNIVSRFNIEDFQASLPEVFHPKIEIYGHTVDKMTKRHFLEYVIEHFIPKQGVHKFKIIAKANQVSKENDLDYYYDKYIDIVTNTVQGLQNIRYYDYNIITEEILEELKQILYDVDSVYSCTYFYHKYQDLMNRIDVHDGYELHFVLRRFFAKSTEFEDLIDFNRQPMLAAKGKSYKDVIVEKWDQLTSPVDLDQFTNELINDYGYHPGTLINIINLALGDYISLRVLYNKKPELSNDTLDKIKNIMHDDFYEIGELTKILDDHGIRVEDYQYFSNFWLKDFGYKTHDVNYIIKEEYSSLKNVFFDKVLSNDIYQITSKDHAMRETTLILFVETLRQEFLAFPTKDEKLITMKYLESKGIMETDIRNYVNALTNYLPKNEYFTYDSLLKNKYYDTDPALKKVELMELSTDLMIDFIRNVPGIKKTTKGDLFRISNEQTTVAEFLDYISKKHNIVDKNELKDFVKENYGLTVKKYEF